MGSLKVPEHLAVNTSTSTPLSRAATNDFVSSPNLMHQSRCLDPGSLSIYAAAAYDANIRRQRSESFVQNRKSKQKWIHDEDIIVRAPSQLCLTRHHHLVVVSPGNIMHSPVQIEPSSSTDIRYHHQEIDRRSSISSGTSTSSSSSGEHSPEVAKTVYAKQEYLTRAEAGAIIGGVLIRRAVRPSFIELPPRSPELLQEQLQQQQPALAPNKTGQQQQQQQQQRQQRTSPGISITTGERWTPPIISPESPFHNAATTADEPLPGSPNERKPHFKDKLGLKKSNSNSSSHSRTRKADQKQHSIFHFKRFGSHSQRPEILPTQPSSLVYPPPPVSFEDNPETDRYGFKKATQWVTLDDHKYHDELYKATLDRRLYKWEQLLKITEPRLPEKSSKGINRKEITLCADDKLTSSPYSFCILLVKRYIRKGVPAHLRGRVWFHYSGAEAKMDSNPGVYEKFLLKADEMGDLNEFADIIARDLHRTFPDNIQFRSTGRSSSSSDFAAGADQNDSPPQPPAIIGALRRVLSAFSVYSPSVGYCQSLNYIVGMLLLFMSEEEAFWTLVAIVQNILPAGVYDVTMEGSNIDQTVLMMLISERLPHLWNKLSDKASFWDSASDSTTMPTITLVTNHWFLTLFINILPIETVLRVWDCFFYEGTSVLFRVALTLFKMSEPLVMNISDSLEIFQVIQNMPKRIIDCQMLIEYTFQKYGSLSYVTHQDLERRREQCRDRRRSGRIPSNKSRTIPRWKLKPTK
ncbi:rab-GTPase-TBC domain-containing protein [Dichotomocladium elegans]|nr:rab-GTPase-TBC domain-containing protein [Dichotomocladium elegans]